jgi:hypothetical protein
MVLLEIVTHGFTLHIVLEGFLEVADVGGVPLSTQLQIAYRAHK